MTSAIRTPDQRLRVFVSSTLAELAPERAAARRAIERLHLIPVMFELGARPHPARELYRAYLAQSDLFVGIYGERYGWVAPGEEVSGLEDEYRLSGELPKLVYLKEPAPHRDDRLGELLATIRDDDRTSYKRFSDPDELEDLLATDLAVLLSERFAAAPARSSQHPDPPPVPLSALLGRSAELDELLGLLDAGERLVSITGPGGVGKTRFALEVARRLADRDRTVRFVGLASVRDPDLVLPTIAEHAGVRAEGSRSVLEGLVDTLGRRDDLVVLDNLEQVIDAAADIATLVQRAPRLQVVVTSRESLRVSGEREMRLSPVDPESAAELFVERARAVRPDLVVTGTEREAIDEICRRLDGLPLAIELAAARVRLLTPTQMLGRLERELDLLAGGGRDLPERQRTLRATIDWSYDLLDEADRLLFERFSVFRGGATLDAVEAVCGDGVDVLSSMASLLDKSLVVAAPERSAEPRFDMLETVRAYAVERLAERGGLAEARRRHVDWFATIGDVAQPFLCGAGQKEWASRLDPERANLRAVVDTAIEAGDAATVIELTWDVIVLYIVRDAVHEPVSWLERAAAVGQELDEVTQAKLDSLRTLLRIGAGDYRDAARLLHSALDVFVARAMDFEAAVTWKEIANVRYFVDGDAAGAVEALTTSARLFHQVGHGWGVSLAETMLGTLLLAGGDLAAASVHLREAYRAAEDIANEPLMAQSSIRLSVVELGRDDTDQAMELLRGAAALARDGGYQATAAECLDAAAAIALELGLPAEAAGALRVARATRDRLGVAVWPTLQPALDDLAARAGVDDRPDAGEAPVEVFTALTSIVRALGAVGDTSGFVRGG